MPGNSRRKIQSLQELYDLLPENELEIVDILRHLVRQHLPSYCKEKLAFSVPYFYGKRGICIIWPATIPGGGIKNGVIFGFWRGKELSDPDGYLDWGTNKKIFYKIFQSCDEINDAAIIKLLEEAVELDNN